MVIHDVVFVYMGVCAGEENGGGEKLSMKSSLVIPWGEGCRHMLM